MKRSKFFASAALIGASATVGGAATTMGLAADAGHHFLSSMPDVEGRRVFVGYPDECHDFTLFAGALAALITDGEWSINPWALYADLAIAIDFVSETETDAEASLEDGWYGASELPMGSVNTIQSRVEINEQNARYARHLTLVATGQKMRDFQRKAREGLLGARSLADALRFLTTAADVSTVHLFSKWQPKQGIREEGALGTAGIVWRPLSAIPKHDLEANRRWSSWHGSKPQSDDFLNRFWSPRWSTES